MSTDTFVAARGIDPSDWRTGLARFGLVAKGVLYITLGVLAFQFGQGGSSGQASQTGAMETIKNQPAGTWLLGLLALGLFAHGIWQLVITFTGDPVEGSEAKQRVKYAVKTVIYLGLGGLAVTVLMGSGSSGGGSGGGGGSSQATSRLLGLPGGVWIVAALGVIVVAVGIAELVRHTKNCNFMERINRTGHGDVRRNVRRVGRAGYAAHAVVNLIIGGFLVVAAVQHDPSESKGLSGALQTLAQQSWGPWLLSAVAIGLAMYGVFALAEARYRRAG